MAGEIKLLWEERAISQRKQFQQTTLSNFNYAVNAVMKLVPKTDDDSVGRALNYMLDAIVEMPVQAACSWAGHSQEIEENVVVNIRAYFAAVRERAKVRDKDGNEIKTEEKTE